MVEFAIFLTLLSAAGLHWFIKTRREEARSEAFVKEQQAKIRARIAERKSAPQKDTGPIEFNLEGPELDDTANGYGNLTPEQNRAIGLIMNGFGGSIERDKKHWHSAPLHTRAGIPQCQSVLDDNVIGPNDPLRAK